jgi:hypothetical protein
VKKGLPDNYVSAALGHIPPDAAFRFAREAYLYEGPFYRKRKGTAQKGDVCFVLNFPYFVWQETQILHPVHGVCWVTHSDLEVIRDS